jgi:anaerobic selenocysteine-containing dehydrogenase
LDRRDFFARVSAVGAAGLKLSSGATPKSAQAAGFVVRAVEKTTRTVTYRVKGFTCITCSVGLEVMLRGLNGVTRANASYPANNVVIAFDEHVTSEKTLKEFITACGFSVA